MPNSRGRSRRVQAQRKFAQGAYVPPAAAPAAAVNADRREQGVDNRNVFINRTSATNLLDVISFQGVHQHMQPVVLIERLRGRNISRESHSSDRDNDRSKQNSNVLNNKNVSKKRTRGKKVKSLKRMHSMSLRSRRLSKMEFKKLEIATRAIRKTRKCPTALESTPKPKRRNIGEIDYCVDASEFSVDDNRPLTYFLTSTPRGPSPTPPVPSQPPLTKQMMIPPQRVPSPPPKLIFTPASGGPQKVLFASRPPPPPPPAPPLPPPPQPSLVQVPRTQPRRESPEPVPGPSGLQHLQINQGTPEIPYPAYPRPGLAGNTLSSTGSVVSGRGSYYSEHNIHRWMNDSLDPESGNDEEYELEDVVEVVKVERPFGPCPANKWVSVRDVINAPKHELDSRCKVCKACERISKLIKLSALLTTQVKIDVTGEDRRKFTMPPRNAADDAVVSSDGNIYLELLPKQPGMMIKLRKHMILGKELFSACLIPRSDARNTKEILLRDQERYLDQLNETLNLSASRTRRRRRRITIDTIRSVESDIIILDPVRQAKCREREAKIRVKTIKLNEARSRLRAAKDAQTRIKAEQELELLALERIKVEKRATAMFAMRSENVPIPPPPPETSAMPGTSGMAYSSAKAEASLMANASQTEASLMAEVDAQARALEQEKDAKVNDCGNSDSSSDGNPDSSGENEERGAKVVEAPVFRPTLEEFEDPMLYFESIWEHVRRYGICRIIPPDGWDPPAKIPDDMRFESTNQYVSRLFNRWGPAARELCAIKLCLQQQNVSFTRLPLVDGVEINLPKLYHLVQCHGGLENVINKKRWGKVAEEMKFNKTPAIERKLDQIYVKYLLPYDTLAHQERQEIMRKVEKAWNRKNQKLLDRALNPLHRQKRMVGESDTSDDEIEDEETANALAEAEDCIVPGLCTNLAKFKKVATNAYEFHFGNRAPQSVSVNEVEDHYWRFVLLGTEHLCVNSASIDTGEEGYGFTKNKNEPYGRHPWNLKMLSANPRNMLCCLGPMLGSTVPTIHIGMVFTTSCWHKDPHGLPWLEHLHFGKHKIWYGIPESQTDNFRKAAETLCPTSCQNKKMWLPSDIAMIPPHILREHNVTITRAVQNRGEFILVFSKAYSCSISVGYTESESVYFAPRSWLEEVPKLFEEARQSCEPTMFSLEQLLISMSQDSRTEQSTLRTIQPTLDKILRQEITNRQVLQEKGVKFVHELKKHQEASSNRQPGAWNERESDECEYCKSTLYLSKVKGITSRRGALCLEHAIKLLNSDKYRHIDMRPVEMHVYVSLRELNNISEGLNQRLSAPDS